MPNPDMASSLDGHNALSSEPHLTDKSVDSKHSSIGRRVDRYCGREATPKLKEHIIPRNGYKVELDERRILDTALDHDRWTINGRTLRNLPEFDNCRMYCDPLDPSELLEKEVKKIVSFATSDHPPLFNSQSSLQGMGLADFEALSGLGDQLYCNFAILIHDNSKNGLEVKTTASQCWNDLISSRRRLKTRYARDDASVICHVEGRQPLCLPQAEKNHIAYCQLLDFILAVIAWWTMRIAKSNYWKNQIIAILAKWAVKLKIVSKEPVEFAALTLSDTDATWQRIQADSEWREGLIKIAGTDRDIAALESETDLTNLYFEEKMILRDYILGMFVTILDTLIIPERSGTDADSFEISALIYRTGLEGITSMLVGHRHGNILATSNLQHINFSYSAFQLLEHYTNALKSTTKSPGVDSVKVDCRVRQGSVQSTSFSIEKMDHLVSLLVPLSLMNPGASRVGSLLINFTHLVSDQDDLIRRFEPPPVDFALEYFVSTKAWLTKLQASTNSAYEVDTLPLSQSPLRRGILDTSTGMLADRKVSRDLARLFEEYQKELPKMSPARWHVTSSAITVNCTTNVAIIQAIAAVIIIGGLAIPFTVRDRFPGVDPFQIAMYTWLVAGAVLIGAKSKYVSSWAWHDFLRGRVTCHRLSDLCEVSGIDPQVVLLWLLHNEWNSLLITQEPYDGMFRKSQRDSNGGVGFSIDVPTEIWTMYASGFVLLVALSASGEHLICIDGRKGGWDAARQQRMGNWMECKDFNQDDLESVNGSGVKDKQVERKIHKLHRNQFEWTKIVGIYNKNSLFG